MIKKKTGKTEKAKKNNKKKKSSKGMKMFIAAKGSDFPLILFTTILVITGVVMIFSASYYYSISREGTPYAYLIKQGIYAISGFLIMNFASNLDYHVWRRYSVWILAGSFVLLLLLFTPLGTEVNGATRWIRFGPISIMPGELAKLAMIIFASAYFAQNSKKAETLRGLFPILGISFVIFILIAKQPNLSTAITVLFIVGGIAFLTGLKYRYVVIAVFTVIFGMFGIAEFGKPYQQKRVTSFLDPFQDAVGDGFQVVQGLLAMGSGGLKGLGIGRSVQKTLYLPEPHTDFILAIIGEENGFWGVALLLTIFLLLIWRCFVISIEAPDKFGMFLSGGLGIMIAVQVILNVAVVTSSMPPTGVALPFISYGGNSLWIFMFLVGVAMNISKQTHEIKLKNDGK